MLEELGDGGDGHVEGDKSLEATVLAELDEGKAVRISIHAYDGVVKVRAGLVEFGMELHDAVDLLGSGRFADHRQIVLAQRLDSVVAGQVVLSAWEWNDSRFAKNVNLECRNTCIAIDDCAARVNKAEPTTGSGCKECDVLGDGSLCNQACGFYLVEPRHGAKHVD